MSDKSRHVSQEAVWSAAAIDRIGFGPGCRRAARFKVGEAGRWRKVPAGPVPNCSQRSKYLSSRVRRMLITKGCITESEDKKEKVLACGRARKERLAVRHRCSANKTGASIFCVQCPGGESTLATLCVSVCTGP